MERLLQLLMRSTASAVLLLSLLGGFAGSAQVVRNRVYGTANDNEELGTMIPLPAGGYFMAGRGYGRLYALRLNANGDTLWTRKLRIPGSSFFYANAATADASGRVLVSGQSFTRSGTSLADAFLVMLNPQGDTLWTKRVASIVNDDYGKAQLLPNGDFLVSGNVNNAPVLMRVTALGQIVWQQALTYAIGDPGYVGRIVPIVGTIGQYWVSLGATNPPYPYKYIRCDASGLTGLSIPGPALPAYAFIADLVPLGSEYLALIGGEIRRLDANFNTLWTQSPTARGLRPLYQKIVPTLDGNFLVGGEAYNQRNVITLNKISPAGLSLADTVFTSFSSVFLKGLAIEPASGDYVFAGYAQNGPIGQADVFWTQWRRSLITGTRGAAPAPGLAWNAYPNPLLDNTVTLQAEQPLRGTLHLRDALGRPLGTWPAAGQRTQALALPPALPAGVYLLTLESPAAAPRTLRLVKP